VRLDNQPLPRHADHRSLDAQRSGFRVNLRPVECKQLADATPEPGEHIYQIDEVVLVRIRRNAQRCQALLRQLDGPL
jgi:Ser-tRNA(Ala) deacylase AlaX